MRKSVVLINAFGGPLNIAQLQIQVKERNDFVFVCQLKQQRGLFVCQYYSKLMFTCLFQEFHKISTCI